MMFENMEARPMSKYTDRPMNITSVPEGAAVYKIFLAPFSKNLFVLSFINPSFPLLHELLSSSKYVDQSYVVTIWT